MRQLPEQCASCGRQIATLGTRVLPDGTQKRGAEVTFLESVEAGMIVAKEQRLQYYGRDDGGSREPT